MPRDFNRIDRIAELIQRELAQIIQRDIEDPRISMHTISYVKVSKDLSHAKIYVSVIFDEKAEETVATLNKASSFLRGALAKKVHLRITPQLHFIYDDTTLKAMKINKLIDDISE